MIMQSRRIRHVLDYSKGKYSCTFSGTDADSRTDRICPCSSWRWSIYGYRTSHLQKKPFLLLIVCATRTHYSRTRWVSWLSRAESESANEYRATTLTIWQGSRKLLASLRKRWSWRRSCKDRRPFGILHTSILARRTGNQGEDRCCSYAVLAIEYSRVSDGSRTPR